MCTRASEIVVSLSRTLQIRMVCTRETSSVIAHLHLSFFLGLSLILLIPYSAAMFRNIVVVLASIFAFTQISTALDEEYDFIVVGSGAGGGPLACRLAEANFKTLLIEAGNDQGDNVNTSIPAFQGVVAQDAKVRWDVSPQHPTQTPQK